MDALSANLTTKRFRKALLGDDPELTLVALIFKQACCDGASVVHLFLDRPGSCMRILEYISVDEAYKPLPWRTVDERDWEVGAIAHESAYFPVECRPASSWKRRDWVQMKPLGLLFPYAVPQCIRRLARMGLSDRTGVLRLRHAGQIIACVVESAVEPTELSESPDLFDLRVYFDSARPRPRKLDDVPLWSSSKYS